MSVAAFFDRTEIPSAPLASLKRSLALALGRIWPNDIARQEAAAYHRLRSWLAHSPANRLSDAEVNRFMHGMNWAEYEKDREGRREFYKTADFTRTFQGMCFPLIRRLVQDDPSIRSILEVGCYYGHNLNLLAREFPKIQVSGVDLFSFIPRLNEDFTEPNLKFHAGYAKDMLASGEIQGDVVLFLSTATRLKPQELMDYLRLIASQGRYVVFNELMQPVPGGVVVDPTALPVNSSIPFLYASSEDTLPPCFLHNYRGMAEAAGYKILHYHAHKPEWTDVYRIVMVAEAPSSARS